MYECALACVRVVVIAFYYRAMHFSAERGIAIVILSVCLSVCLLHS